MLLRELMELMKPVQKSLACRKRGIECALVGLPKLLGLVLRQLSPRRLAQQHLVVIGLDGWNVQRRVFLYRQHLARQKIKTVDLVVTGKLRK